MVRKEYMYNFGGIYYQMKSNVSSFVIVGIILFLLSRCWSKAHRNLKEMLLGILCIILAISSIIYYTMVLNNPEISTYEGYYVKEHRVYKRLLEKEYIFFNGEGLKPVFYLDIFTKKEIFPEDFDSKKLYRIFYEERKKKI